MAKSYDAFYGGSKTETLAASGTPSPYRFVKKRMTPLQSFKAKNDYMCERFPELTPLQFYTELFPPEHLERKGDNSFRASNPIFSFKVSKDGRTYFQNEIVFQDTFAESLAKTAKNDLALCAPITYSGRKKSAKNAYKCHGFCIDLDGVGINELQSLLGQIEWLEKVPWPTYIANSGHGLHVYYIFQVPVPLYPQVVEHLQTLKRGLTALVWNRETSTYKPKDRQFQGIYQSFRMPGSRTKLGSGTSRNKYLVRVWRVGKPCSLEYLNGFVDAKFRCPTNPDYSSWDWADEGHYSLEECRLLYPDWYEKRIIKGEPTRQWKCNRGLYDWWLRKIQENDEITGQSNAKDGNRFHCISMLYVYGKKCMIAKSLIDADAMELLEPFNELTVHDDNSFTIADIKAASDFYDKSYSARFTRKEIERRTGIQIPPARRNGRKQDEHLKRARIIRTISSYDSVGRPDKKTVIAAWRKKNPNGNQSQCARETGVSRPTVIKWWDSE